MTHDDGATHEEFGISNAWKDRDLREQFVKPFEEVDPDPKVLNSFVTWWKKRLRKNDIEKMKFDDYQRLELRVRRGLPPDLRWSLWKVLLNTKEHSSCEGGVEEYKRLAMTETPCRQQIEMDVPRTFPDLVGFNRVSITLTRLLNAAAARDPAVGYCQGMNFLVSFLLVIAMAGGENEESEIYFTFVGLMETLHFKNFFSKGFPLLTRYYRAFETIFECHFGDVRDHMMSLSMSPSIFVHQWFLTLYVTALPMSTTAVIWDRILFHGLPATLEVALAIMGLIHCSILRQVDDQDLATLFRSSLRNTGNTCGVTVGRLIVRQTSQYQKYFNSQMLGFLDPRGER